MSHALRTCPLCDASDFKELYLTKDRHYGISGSYRVVRCVRCLLVMLNPMYSDQELAALYPGDYYAYQDKFRVRHWRELARKVLGYYVGTKEPRFKAPGTILDLGCGSGWFSSLSGAPTPVCRELESQSFSYPLQRVWCRSP